MITPEPSRLVDPLLRDLREQAAEERIVEERVADAHHLLGVDADHRRQHPLQHRRQRGQRLAVAGGRRQAGHRGDGRGGGGRGLGARGRGLGAVVQQVADAGGGEAAERGGGSQGEQGRGRSLHRHRLGFGNG
jgi:hypothetical protein